MNSKSLLYILLFFSLTLYSGCSSSTKISEVMDSWVGSHYSDMMLQWGPPTYSADDGKGGQILVYQYDRRGSSIPGYAKKVGEMVFYTAPRTVDYTAERMFWVNNKGIIYTWRWKGI